AELQPGSPGARGFPEPGGRARLPPHGREPRRHRSQLRPRRRRRRRQRDVDSQRGPAGGRQPGRACPPQRLAGPAARERGPGRRQLRVRDAHAIRDAGQPADPPALRRAEQVHAAPGAAEGARGERGAPAVPHRGLSAARHRVGEGPHGPAARLAVHGAAQRRAADRESGARGRGVLPLRSLELGEEALQPGGRPGSQLRREERVPGPGDCGPAAERDGGGRALGRAGVPRDGHPRPHRLLEPPRRDAHQPRRGGARPLQPAVCPRARSPRRRVRLPRQQARLAAVHHRHGAARRAGAPRDHAAPRDAEQGPRRHRTLHLQGGGRAAARHPLAQERPAHPLQRARAHPEQPQPGHQPAGRRGRRALPVRGRERGGFGVRLGSPHRHDPRGPAGPATQPACDGAVQRGARHRLGEARTAQRRDHRVLHPLPEGRRHKQRGVPVRGEQRHGRVPAERLGARHQLHHLHGGLQPARRQPDLAAAHREHARGRSVGGAAALPVECRRHRHPRQLAPPGEGGEPRPRAGLPGRVLGAARGHGARGGGAGRGDPGDAERPAAEPRLPRAHLGRHRLGVRRAVAVDPAPHHAAQQPHR
ncbi:unnamed protein product, partial [Lampetra fluviatilis]